MLCSYCNANRPNNEAACPNCGAPSPLVGQNAGATSWNNNAQPSWGNADATDQWDYQGPQFSFGESGMNLPPDEQSTTAYQQPPVSEQRSLVPVSYQGNLNLQLQQMQERSLPVIQSPSVEQMLSALPEDATYVPPMYIKPRPIIPRYRVISGLISFTIVTLLLCGGLGFYARSSGMLHNLRVWAAGGPPASLQTAKTQTLADPKDTPDKGPAYGIISSATTASRIDTKTKSPLDQAKIFKPNQPFYLTYVIPHPKDKGTVTVKWYTNGSLFTTTPPQDIPASDQDWHWAITIAFAQATEGKVEIYWNDQMAQTLYFVVRP